MNKVALIIEDDRDLAELVRTHVEHMGYQLDHVIDGKEGLERALSREYAFVILDYMLPSLGGVEICKGIRDQKKDLPIIMLTTKSDELSKVLLLELGADDYVTKPFSVLELTARIKAVLRRSDRSIESSAGEARNLEYNGLEINFEKRTVSLDGAPIQFTTREFDLLAILASSPGRPFTRDELNQELYGHYVSGYEQSINVHINRIRAKLKRGEERSDFIFTIRGFGYRFAEIEQS